MNYGFREFSKNYQISDSQDRIFKAEIREREQKQLSVNLAR